MRTLLRPIGKSSINKVSDSGVIENYYNDVITGLYRSPD